MTGILCPDCGKYISTRFPLHDCTKRGQGLNLVTLEHSDKWGYFWQRGAETFYNERREWLTYPTEEAARAWLADHTELTEARA